MSNKLEFSDAPIIEVVCGAQFDGIVFDQQFVFEVYEKIKKDFPIIQQNPPINSVIEKIDAPNINKALAGFHPRTFFINKDNNKLIQIQPDKVFFNWRKTNNEEQYPHFENVFQEFKKTFNMLLKGANASDKLNQFELTYYDHILLSKFDKDDYNPIGILNLISLEGQVKSLDLKMSFPVIEAGGNITLVLRSATRNTDQEKLLILESTCRGFKSDSSIEKWFDVAHNRLLSNFKNITTEEAKTVWGKK